MSVKNIEELLRGQYILQPSPAAAPGTNLHIVTCGST